MSNEEKITAKYFAQGLVKPKTHIKTLSFTLILAFWILIGFMVWKTFFKKEAPTQQTQIHADSGSNVKVTNITKTSRFFIPYIEVGVEQMSNSDMGTYIRGGLRVEF
jgi:cytoskeletal protein RodZ